MLGFAAAVGGCDESLGETTEDVDSAALWVQNDVEDLDAIDFCVRGRGAWLGPVMDNLLGIQDGLEQGMETGPLPLAAGSYVGVITDAATGLCVPAINEQRYDLEIEAGDFDIHLTGSAFPDAGDEPLDITVTPR